MNCYGLLTIYLIDLKLLLLMVVCPLLQIIKIAQVDSAKYLGAFIDSKLNWCEHTLYVKKKISPEVGLIRK